MNDNVKIITYIMFFGINIGDKVKCYLHFSDICKHESNDLLLSFNSNKKREIYQNKWHITHEKLTNGETNNKFCERVYVVCIVKIVYQSVILTY